MSPDRETGGRAARLEARVERALARRSSAMFAAFARIFTHALKRDFHAVRLSRSTSAPQPSTPHLLIYSNHPSWWDAMVYALLARKLFPERPGFAPIDARMIARYRFMERIGTFPVAQDSRDGAAFFLAAASRILERRDGLLCVSAQGRFTDARARPVQLAPGIAHLAARVPQAVFVPLAIDYVFWDERAPELLLRFGEPVPARSLVGMNVAARNQHLAGRLEDAMDHLAEQAIARDAAAFQTLLEGSTGVGGVYDLWRRSRAMVRGERFSPAHGDGR